VVRTARTLSEKVALGRQRIMQVVEASLRRSKSVRFQNGKWLLATESNGEADT